MFVQVLFLFETLAAIKMGWTALPALNDITRARCKCSCLGYFLPHFCTLMQYITCYLQCWQVFKAPNSKCIKSKVDYKNPAGQILHLFWVLYVNTCSEQNLVSLIEPQPRLISAEISTEYKASPTQYQVQRQAHIQPNRLKNIDAQYWYEKLSGRLQPPPANL